MVKMTKKVYRAWVTFTLPSSLGESVEVSGSWNDWKKEPLKVKKNGDFSITKILKTGKSYQFGYIVNGKEWHTDESLKCVTTEFHSENSVLEL